MKALRKSIVGSTPSTSGFTGISFSRGHRRHERDGTEQMTANPHILRHQDSESLRCFHITLLTGRPDGLHVRQLLPTLKEQRNVDT